MSATAQLCSCLEKILRLQKSLHQIAIKKTEMIKADNIDALGQLLKDELKHIKAIEVVDKEREQVQQEFAKLLSIPSGNITISDLLLSNLINDKEKLRELQSELVDQMQKLKETNELNQELLQQSLSFVTLNLDLLTGQQESNNYHARSSDEPESFNRSLFDSKA